MSSNRPARRRVSIPKVAPPPDPVESVLTVGVAAAIGTLRHGEGTRAELQERARWQMLHAGLTAEMMLPAKEEVATS